MSCSLLHEFNSQDDGVERTTATANETDNCVKQATTNTGILHFVQDDDLKEVQDDNVKPFRMTI
jgi:hypothetical protein